MRPKARARPARAARLDPQACFRRRVVSLCVRPTGPRKRPEHGRFALPTLTPGASYPPEKVISRARAHQICGGFLAILWRQLSKCDATEGFRFEKQQLESFVDDQPL
ncbi:unnamed protein product [Caenorhabditis auriculariae]|uniref:Uncharacterized protein n=1 Tax=Caenorhabditis auriculariae TaxID=2777116 RepID=A0A8S1GXU9_9PELO|nr:unnamed protein product [Caenorhabditis auriculariae]